MITGVDEWRWDLGMGLSEPVIFTAWNGGEPTNAGQNEDIITIESGGKWNDLPYDLSGNDVFKPNLCFICEYK